jgi:hypothetical protein
MLDSPGQPGAGSNVLRKSRAPQARRAARRLWVCPANRLPRQAAGRPVARRLWASPAKRLRWQAAGRRSALTALISPSGRRCQRLCRLTCGKPVAFRPIPAVPSSSALAGRLSLPASAVVLLARPAERQSLSASQAAKPQVVADANQRNLDKPGPRYSLRPTPRDESPKRRRPRAGGGPLPWIPACAGMT